MNLDLKKAKAYQRKKYFLALFHLGLELFLLLLLILTGISFFFKEGAEAVTDRFSLQVAVYYGIFFLYLWIFDLPLDFYSEFGVEHRYGLSNQNLRSWAVEFLKKTFLSFGLSLLLILGLYFLIQRFPASWWLWAWLGFAGVSTLLGQLFPVLIVPLFYRYRRLEEGALKERIFQLVQRFHLPLENVYSLNLSKTTKKANAMFAGLGRTKRLVLADTLIQNFTVEEIESVVAHELGHFKHRDLWRHLGFNLVVSLAGFALAFHLLERLAPLLGYHGAEDLAAFPLLYLVFYLFATLLTPLSHAYSRWREREADRFALKAAGSGGFIPAMEKLGRLNLADPRPHPFIEWWFYTHPPIEKRIQMARNFLCLSVFYLLTSVLSVFLPESGFSEERESDREAARKEIEARTRTQILNYFLGRPQDTSAVGAPFAVELYNQAVEFYQKKEYELAREALQDSLAYDSKNPFAHELLGDIAYYEQKLAEAEGHYQSAFRFQSREGLREKILKVQKEKETEAGLATYSEEHFVIKYGGEEKGLEGFELSELLRTAYREVGQDLGYFFKHKLVVLLYDEKEFRELSGIPHWSGGVYDGKIRLPAYQKGFTQKEIEGIMRHELTHAFVEEIAQGRAPVWLNEGLAEYEQAKVEPRDLRVFRAALRTNTLFPLPSLFTREGLSEVKDPLEVELFYEEASQLVSYLVERYGMFRVKKMLELFSQGKDSFEVIQEVLLISPLELEEQWKESLAQP